MVCAAIFPCKVTVHPHVCGEHAFPRMCLRQYNGSSPRVWGTCQPGVASRPHPHGSSPRVWGTCRACSVVGDLQRFIPTCVGNIPPTSGVSGGGTVHPHVCGEHTGRQPRSPHAVRFILTCVGNIRGEGGGWSRYAGSSPRVWGTSSRRA